MEILQKLKESSVWDKTYDLPMIPGHNNPFIYLALITKLYRIVSGHYFFEGTENYIKQCQIVLGLYNRRPDGSGGVTSHDELIGISFLYNYYTYLIFVYLKFTKGVYNNTDPSDRSLRYNLYRFPWFIAFLKSRVYKHIGLFYKLCYSVHVLLNSFGKLNSDSCLMIWLMNDHLERFQVCRWAIKYWRYKLKKQDVTLSSLFQEHLPDHPILVELSKDCEI